MPASPSLVSLDHAKQWAKRLHQAAPALGNLASAQAAVATMLGHSDWHALTAFYTPRPADGPDPHWEARYLLAVRRRYPGLNPTGVEAISREIVELHGDTGDVHERFQEFENEGYFPEDALEEALKVCSVTTQAPPGHVMVRVRNASNEAFWVPVSHQELDLAHPPESQAPPSGKPSPRRG